MCFTIYDKVIHTADRNITCYKVVRGNEKGTCFASMHQSFAYDLGFHYYNDNFPKKIGYKRQFHGQGLHSFTKVARTFNYIHHTYSVAIKCYIPKGAKYMIDPTSDEYISSDIVIMKVLTRKKLIELKKVYDKRQKKSTNR